MQSTEKLPMVKTILTFQKCSWKTESMRSNSIQQLIRPAQYNLNYNVYIMRTYDTYLCNHTDYDHLSYFRRQLTMYMGLPQRVAAITPSCKNLANPKSATKHTSIGKKIYEFRFEYNLFSIWFPTVADGVWSRCATAGYFGVSGLCGRYPSRTMLSSLQLEKKILINRM